MPQNEREEGVLNLKVDNAKEGAMFPASIPVDATGWNDLKRSVKV